MEAIINRTAEQEAELNSKKAELADLQQTQDPKKTNWTPWLIGGGVILVLVVGAIAYYWGKNKEK